MGMLIRMMMLLLGGYTIYTVDGSQETAVDVRFDAGKDNSQNPQIVYDNDKGERRALPLSSFGYLENNLAKLSKDGKYMVVMRRGNSRNEDSLMADSLRIGESAVRLAGGVFGSLEYKEHCVSKIVVIANYKEAHEKSMGSDSEDVLVKANGDVSRGILVSFGDEHVVFESESLGSVSYKTSEISVISLVMGPGGGKDSDDGLWRILLSDKSRLVGKVARISGGAIELSDRFGHALVLPLDNVISASYENPSYRYLSDLDPIEAIVSPHQIEGLPELKRDYQRDMSAKKTILSMRGKRFSKGLGVRARTTLRYKLGGSFNHFHAIIGIDDCVDPAARKYADARFHVYGDGKLLFKSDVKRYRDDPQYIKIGIKGVDILELTADFGDVPEIGDWADWASARITK